MIWPFYLALECIARRPQIRHAAILDQLHNLKSERVNPGPKWAIQWRAASASLNAKLSEERPNGISQPKSQEACANSYRSSHWLTPHSPKLNWGIPDVELEAKNAARRCRCVVGSPLGHGLGLSPIVVNGAVRLWHKKCHNKFALTFLDMHAHALEAIETRFMMTFRCKQRRGGVLCGYARISTLERSESLTTGCGAMSPALWLRP